MTVPFNLVRMNLCRTRTAPLSRLSCVILIPTQITVKMYVLTIQVWDTENSMVLAIVPSDSHFYRVKCDLFIDTHATKSIVSYRSYQSLPVKPNLTTLHLMLCWWGQNHRSMLPGECFQPVRRFSATFLGTPIEDGLNPTGADFHNEAGMVSNLHKGLLSWDGFPYDPTVQISPVSVLLTYHWSKLLNQLQCFLSWKATPSAESWWPHKTAGLS